MMDPSQMEQILMNLCLNAQDAIPEQGHLVLETSHITISESQRDDGVGIPPGRYVRLIVRDDGKGMDAGTLALIFEPYYTTKVFGKGHGLGLATVQGIIKQSQGFIEVSSQPNRGTTFTIYLPALEKQLLPQRTLPTVTPGSGRIKTILIVEDEEAIRRLIVFLLESSERRLLQAENGEHALEIIREYPEEIDLLITDVMMPGMNGFRLAGLLKSSHPRLRVMYISGHSEESVSHQGVALDKACFLKKPFSSEAFRKKVAEELSRSE